jgi:hypothetical protein
MKLILIILSLIISLKSFSQSKKEQIEILNKQVDSLKQKLIYENNYNIQKYDELNSKKENLLQLLEKEKTINKKINSENGALSKEVTLINQELKKKNTEIGFLLDSIGKIILNSKSITSDSELVINKQMFIKPPNDQTKEIDEYLNNFKLIGNYIFKGKQTGNPSWNSSDGEEDPYSWFTRNISLYEHGIIMWKFQEHEGASYDLFIPMISIIEGKKLTQVLCKNMGGCTPPEEVEVVYEEVMGGILVHWGGGC